MAHGGSGHAGTVDHDHTCPATHTGLRDHAVGLISWREWHCLCGGSERQPEQSEHYCFDHCFLPEVQNSLLCGLLGSLLAGIAQDREFVRYRHNSNGEDLPRRSYNLASASPDEPKVNVRACAYLIVEVGETKAPAQMSSDRGPKFLTE